MPQNNSMPTMLPTEEAVNPMHDFAKKMVCVYMDEMQQQGTWGGNDEIKAIAKVLGIKIVLHQTNKFPNHSIIPTQYKDQFDFPGVDFFGEEVPVGSGRIIHILYAAKHFSGLELTAKAGTYNVIKVSDNGDCLFDACLQTAKKLSLVRDEDLTPIQLRKLICNSNQEEYYGDIYKLFASIINQVNDADPKIKITNIMAFNLLSKLIQEKVKIYIEIFNDNIILKQMGVTELIRSLELFLKEQEELEAKIQIKEQEVASITQDEDRIIELTGLLKELEILQQQREIPEIIKYKKNRLQNKSQTKNELQTQVEEIYSSRNTGFLSKIGELFGKLIKEFLNCINFLVVSSLLLLKTERKSEQTISPVVVESLISPLASPLPSSSVLDDDGLTPEEQCTGNSRSILRFSIDKASRCYYGESSSSCASSYGVELQQTAARRAASRK